MDINHLKIEIDRVLRLIEQEGRPFQFAALTPAYPGMADTSFVLQVRADWISRPNEMDGLRYLLQKLYANLEANTLRYLNRVGVPDERGGVLFLTDDLILRNEGAYQPEEPVRMPVAA